MFHVDGRVLKSFRLLLRQPGQLTIDYLRGRRKPYVRPVELFLLANLLYFLIQPFTGFAAFTTPLSTHLAGPGTILWEGLAERMVARRLAERQIPFATYEHDFNEMAHLQGKSLLILMVPLFALGAWGLNRNARRYYVEHLIFCFHFYATVLLAMAAVTFLTQLFLSGVARVGHRFSYFAIESTSSAILLVILGWYSFRSVRLVFQRSAMLAGVQTLILLGWSQIVLSGYRFLLFMTTFAAT